MPLNKLIKFIKKNKFTVVDLKKEEERHEKILLYVEENNLIHYVKKSKI